MRTVPDVEWDDEQQGWAQAHAELLADTCPGCGGYLSETTDPAHEGGYVVDNPHRCHRCTSVAVKRREYLEGSPHPHALHFFARLRDQTHGGAGDG